MFNIQRHWMSIFAKFVRKISSFIQCVLTHELQYQSRDPDLHEKIVDMWQQWFSLVNNSSEASSSGNVADASSVGKL